MRATLLKMRRPNVMSATRYRSRPSRSPMNVKQHGDDRVDQEPADEDPIVVDPVELCTDRPEDRIECGEDRHRRVSAELEADVDVEDETRQDAHEEPEQGEQHADVVLVPVGFGKATRPPEGAATRRACRRGASGAHGAGLGFGDDLADGVGRGMYVPSVSEARMIRSTCASRPTSRLRRRRTWPGMRLGRAQARRVEAEDRRPAGRPRADDEPVLVGQADREPLRRAADVRGPQGAEPGRGIEVDRSRARRPTDRPADAARRSSMTGSAAASSGGFVAEPREQVARRVDEVPPRADLPDEDRLALLERDRERVRQLDLDPGPRDRGQLAEPALPAAGCRAGTGSRRGRSRGLPRRPSRRCTWRPVDPELRVLEGRRRGDAVDRRGRRERDQRRPGPDPRTGRPRRAGPAVSAARGVRAGTTGGSAGRPLIAAGPPAAGAPVTRAAWRSSASSTTRAQTSANV